MSVSDSWEAAFRDLCPSPEEAEQERRYLSDLDAANDYADYLERLANELPAEPDWDDYGEHRGSVEPNPHAAFVLAMETDVRYAVALAA